MDNQVRTLVDDQTTNESSFDLGEYLRIVDRAKWKIIAFTIVVAIATAFYALGLTPQYTASVTLMIEPERANTVSIREIYDVNDNNTRYYSTQFEILRSRQMAEKVIEQLDLLNKADYDRFLPDYAQQLGVSESSLRSYLTTGIGEGTGNDVPESEVKRLATQAAVKLFQQKLSFQPVFNTQLINISYDSADPDLAAEVANGLAEIYIQSFLESKIEMEAKASAWMNERMATIKEKLTEAEADLQSFLEREGLVDVSGITSLAQRELDDLSRQLSAARVRVSQSKSIYDLTTQGQTLDNLISIPEVLNHPVIRQVKNAEIEANQQISELAQVYGPRHQQMIAAQAELDTVRSTLEDEVRKLVSGIQTEYRTALTNLDTVNAKLEAAKREFQRLSAIEREYDRLQGEVQINQELYTTFFTRLKETSETSGFQTANARILDRAVPPEWPSKPGKKKIVVFATGAAFIFAVGLVFLFDLLSGGVRSLDDIERRLRQRMLGIIPFQKLKKNEELPIDLYFNEQNKGFAEAIRTIRTSLLMSQMDNPPKVIAVTSSVPGEGKTTLSTNLAYALGQMERVLLIDADLRRPTLGKRFGYPPYQAGLSNLIANTANLSTCIQTDQKSGIDLLVAGAIPPNPQELLSSDLMKTAMKLLSAKYDRIIIDTAPTQAVADSLIVSTHSDAMIYVVKSESTHIKNIKSGLGRLLQIGANVAGVVLNQVDLEQSSKYGDYEGYYDQYGYNQDSEQVLASQGSEKAESGKAKTA